MTGIEENPLGGPAINLGWNGEERDDPPRTGRLRAVTTFGAVLNLDGIAISGRLSGASEGGEQRLSADRGEPGRSRL